MQVDQSTHLYSVDAPVGIAEFSAQASLTNAAAQNIPKAALATSLSNESGVLVGRPGLSVTRMRVRFTGDGANVGGQTAVFQVLRSTDNGATWGAVAAAVTTAMATTAGGKSQEVDFASAPLTLSSGDLLRPTVTPSGALTAVLTNLNVVLY